MSEKSAIEWTDATWNPVTGCTKVSPACANCYIERQTPFRVRHRKFVKGHIPLEFHENRLDAPLHWRDPRRVFVNSMSDLFHEDVPDVFIDRVFAVMALARWHTYQVLTKRAERLSTAPSVIDENFVRSALAAAEPSARTSSPTICGSSLAR
jgi:protein gp37